MRGRSLRNRIWLLLLAGLMPVVLLSAALMTYQDFLQERARANLSVQTTVGNVAAAAQDFASATKDLLEVLTEFPTVRQMDVEGSGRLFGDVVSLRPWLRGLYLADEKGDVLASAGGTSPRASPGVLPYLRSATAFSYASVSGRLEAVAGGPSAMVTVPLRDSFGRRIGMVAGEIELRELQWNWANRPATRGEQIIVVDGRGQVLVHTDVSRLSAMGDLAGWPPVAAQEEQRRKIAEDIHDGVAQLVAGALLETQNIKRYVSQPQEVLARLESVRQLLQDSVMETRGAIWGLYPVELERVGLVSAIDAMAERFSDRYSIRCQVSVSGEPFLLDPQAQLTAYRVAQEALRNCARHSGASQVSVALAFTADAFRLSVADDGRGFVQGRQEEGNRWHLGLRSMRDRARLAGGDLEIRSAPDCGTTITLSIPVQPPSAVADPPGQEGARSHVTDLRLTG